MPKKLLAVAIILLLGITSLSAASIVTANFAPLQNSINILSPSTIGNSYFHYDYQNSTVNLTISVTYVGLTGTPKVSFISYSLDGQPSVYLRNLSVSKWFYSQYSQDITSYRITTILENLSDGNHTIEAYANDMSTARTFTVDSHYVVPTISVLSPTNQTYNGKVPLMFAVNTNFTEASYLIWPKTMDTHYEGQLSGNSSVSNLPNGNYFMDLWAITEKGEYVEATANFTINTGSQLPLELDPFVVYIMMGIVIAIVAVGSVSLICYKRRKGEP